MGMFDNIRIKYPLPELPETQDFDYQTKCTEAQALDNYEIREDGSLWHENYEIEDRSELSKWMKENPGKETPEQLTGLNAIAGLLTRVNRRWEPEPLTGEIVFYTFMRETPTEGRGWVQWSAYFVDGKLKEIHLISHEPAA